MSIEPPSNTDGPSMASIKRRKVHRSSQPRNHAYEAREPYPNSQRAQDGKGIANLSLQLLKPQKASSESESVDNSDYESASSDGSRTVLSKSQSEEASNASQEGQDDESEVRSMICSLLFS